MHLPTSKSPIHSSFERRCIVHAPLENTVSELNIYSHSLGARESGCLNTCLDYTIYRRRRLRVSCMKSENSFRHDRLVGDATARRHTRERAILGACHLFPPPVSSAQSATSVTRRRRRSESAVTQRYDLSSFSHFVWHSTLALSLALPTFVFAGGGAFLRGRAGARLLVFSWTSR